MFSSCSLSSLSQPHHVTASHPSPVENHQSNGGQSERQRAKKKWLCETHSVTYVLGTFSNLLRIDEQPPPSFLCCPRLASHHPSSLTSVSIVLALHLLPPSTPFWPYGTHPFFPHALTISILSDLLYSLTPFLFQLSKAPLHSLLYPFVTLQPNFLYPMPLLRTTPFVQLLLHIDTYWPLSPVLNCSAHFSALPTLYTPHWFCVPCNIACNIP